METTRAKFKEEVEEIVDRDEEEDSSNLIDNYVIGKSKSPKSPRSAASTKSSSSSRARSASSARLRRQHKKSESNQTNPSTTNNNSVAKPTNKFNHEVNYYSSLISSLLVKQKKTYDDNSNPAMVTFLINYFLSLSLIHSFCLFSCHLFHHRNKFVIIIISIINQLLSVSVVVETIEIFSLVFFLFLSFEILFYFIFLSSFF